MLSHASPACPSGAQWSRAELIVPTGGLVLPAVGGLMVASFLVVSAILLAVGYPAGDLSLWAAE